MRFVATAPKKKIASGIPNAPSSFVLSASIHPTESPPAVAAFTTVAQYQNFSFFMTDLFSEIPPISFMASSSEISVLSEKLYLEKNGKLFSRTIFCLGSGNFFLELPKDTKTFSS